VWVHELAIASGFRPEVSCTPNEPAESMDCCYHGVGRYSCKLHNARPAGRANQASYFILDGPNPTTRYIITH
jgi:hypothetical protein